MTDNTSTEVNWPISKADMTRGDGVIDADKLTVILNDLYSSLDFESRTIGRLCVEWHEQKFKMGHSVIGQGGGCQAVFTGPCQLPAQHDGLCRFPAIVPTQPNEQGPLMSLTGCLKTLRGGRIRRDSWRDGYDVTVSMDGSLFLVEPLGNDRFVSQPYSPRVEDLTAEDWVVIG